VVAKRLRAAGFAATGVVVCAEGSSLASRSGERDEPGIGDSRHARPGERSAGRLHSEVAGRAPEPEARPVAMIEQCLKSQSMAHCGLRFLHTVAGDVRGVEV
jgi:hypothetical protein